MNQTLDAVTTEAEDTPTGTRGRWAFWLLIFAITAFATLYAVTRAFVWDEGYHLIAAQQISRGKLPYIDFCFPQTLLNAYLNAGILKVFGQHWRPIHVGATLFSMGSMLLTAQYLLTSFPARRWRLACALSAAVFVGLNEVVIQFGTIGQAYGICLFFSMAAYRVALATPARVTILLPLSCGMLAGVAADSSLLTAPILPVLLVWIWLYDRVGFPWRKAFAFSVGAGIPFLPVVWLYFKSPQQTLFNVVRYHALFRRVDWPTEMANHHDLLVFTSLVDSTQMALMFTSFLAQMSDQTTWQEYEKVAKKVAEVTPKGGRIFADELVYFALQTSPPSGMECSYTHTVALPPKEEKLQHLVSEAQLKEQFARREFDTVQSCSDAEVGKLGLPGSYPHKIDMDDCTVYWGGRNSQQVATQP
jgi:hypothetical protein